MEGVIGSVGGRGGDEGGANGGGDGRWNLVRERSK